MSEIYDKNKEAYEYYTKLLTNSISNCNKELEGHFNVLNKGIYALEKLCSSPAPKASEAIDDINIKITKYIELEKPLIDSNGSTVKRLAVRNAFLIERIDATVEYQTLLDRYYQILKVGSGGSGDCPFDCCDAIEIISELNDTIYQMWQCIQNCCEITNNRITALYEMVDNMSSTDLIDMPSTLIPDRYLRVNSTGTGYELVELDVTIYTDATLTGDGSSGDPLSVVPVESTVHTDATLIGDGSSGDPLSVVGGGGGISHEQEETFPDPTLLNEGDEFWHNQTLTLYKIFDNDGTKIWVQSKDSGGAKLLTYLRLTDIDMATYTYYTGYAPLNSLETDDVWTITKIISDEEGVVASKVKYYNVAWSDRGTL